MRVLPVYYGWFVLTASAIPELLVQGATSYGSSLFVLPLQAEFHISRADANTPVLILFAGAMLVSPLVGRALDAWPIRLVICLGAVILALSFAGIALAPALWMMAPILFLPGAIAFMALGPLNTSTLAARWFRRRRGLAMGIAAVATSGGGFIVVPLLSVAIQRYGWRPALLYEGIIMAVVIIALALLVVRDRPSDIGLADHVENQSKLTDLLPSLSPDWKTVFTSRAFWIPSLTLAAISGTCQATVLTLVPYGVQLGFAASKAALLVSAFALSAGTTKVAAGILADCINQRFLLIVAALCMTLSWLSLSLFATFGGVLIGALLAGTALGCSLPTAAGLIAAGFGSTRFGSVMGYTYALILGCAILSGRFVGFMFDHFASYHAAFIAFSEFLACILLLTLLVPLGRLSPTS